MSTFTTGESPDHLQERLAEAACYAVLRRVAPVLRHDVAGFMQPVGMLMMVLQRRVQMPEPDLQAIAKNVMSVSALTKEATTGCMNAMGWMASREDTNVSLFSGVDEIIKLLAMELSGRGIEIASELADDGAQIPQSFLRSVLVGALLAFCDQRTTGGTLRVCLEAEPGSDCATRGLVLRLQPGVAANSPAAPDAVPKSRSIGWSDIEAMARSFGISMARGDDWLALGLPKAG